MTVRELKAALAALPEDFDDLEICAFDADEKRDQWDDAVKQWVREIGVPWHHRQDEYLHLPVLGPRPVTSRHLDRMLPAVREQALKRIKGGKMPYRD